MHIQETIWTHYYQLGNSALAARQLDVAEQMFAAASEEARRRSIKPLLLADSWFGLGQTHHCRKQHDLAAYFYKKAMSVYEDEPRLRLKLAACWDNLAELCLISGDLTKAQTLYRKAIAQYEKTLGHDSAVLAPRLMHLGHVYAELKLFDKALLCYQRAKSITQKDETSEVSEFSKPAESCNTKTSGSVTPSKNQAADREENGITIGGNTKKAGDCSDRALHSVPVRRRALENMSAVQTPFVGAPL